MSMINRMLSDLESRGAPKPKAGDTELVPERTAESRRRPAWNRVFLAVLAIALVALAVALWIERGDRMLAGLYSVVAAKPAEDVERVPALVGIAFEGPADQPRLMLQIDGPLDGSPQYTRSGGSATLVLAARSSDVMVPSPPSGQGVFRGLALEPESQRRTRLRLDVAPIAELELNVDGARLTLAGHMPQVHVDEAIGGAGEVDETAPSKSRAEGSGHAAAETETAAEKVAGAGPESTVEESTASSQAEPQTAAETESVEPARDQRDNDPATSVKPDDTDPVEGTSPPVQARASGGNGESGLSKNQSLDPETRAIRRYREGRKALSSGRLGEARRLLSGALELDPALHPARDLLASLMRRAGDGDAARRLLDKGIELAPGRVEYAMPYARLLVDTEELERAASVLARARTAGAGNAGFHALAAAVAQRRGRHEQAAEEYTRALEIDADNGLWWLGLGISLAATERGGEARAAFREARASGDLDDNVDRWVARRIEELSGEG